MTEYIVQIEDSEKNMSERFVGQLRSYPELIRCKDCKWYISYQPYSDGYERMRCENMCGLYGDVSRNAYCSEAERKTE